MKVWFGGLLTACTMIAAVTCTTAASTPGNNVAREESGAAPPSATQVTGAPTAQPTSETATAGTSPGSPAQGAPPTAASSTSASGTFAGTAAYWRAYQPVTSCSVSGTEATLTTADGLTVRGYFARPSGSKTVPGVLVLHTRGGLGGHERAVVGWLADAGFAAFAPNYFTPLGLAPLPADDRNLVQTLLMNDGDRIRGVLARSLECLLSLPDVSPKYAGVVGFSLGGGFALDLATHPRVQAIAPWYTTDLALVTRPGAASRGEIVGEVRAAALLLAGEADPLLRVAQGMRDNLARAGKSVDLVIYPGVGHGWDQPASPVYTYSAAATSDARARTVTLLQRSLQ